MRDIFGFCTDYIEISILQKRTCAILSHFVKVIIRVLYNHCEIQSLAVLNMLYNRLS